MADVESPTENSFTPPVSSESSSASEAERPLPPSMETPPPNVVEQEVPQRESAQEILDSHVSLKQVTLRSAGGCNENIGKSTLLLTISLSER